MIGVACVKNSRFTIAGRKMTEARGGSHLRVVVSPPAVTRPLTLDELFRKHVGFVGRIAFRLLGRDAEVDDVVQEVFVDAVRASARLDLTQPMEGWLATVTVRIVGKRLRRRRLRRLLGFDSGGDYEAVASTDASPEVRASIARVYTALDEIAPVDRIAWMLRHIDGERLDVVASRCDCSLATAKRRIAAAHAELRRRVVDG